MHVIYSATLLTPKSIQRVLEPAPPQPALVAEIPMPLVATLPLRTIAIFTRLGAEPIAFDRTLSRLAPAGRWTRLNVMLHRIGPIRRVDAPDGPL